MDNKEFQKANFCTITNFEDKHLKIYQEAILKYERKDKNNENILEVSHYAFYNNNVRLSNYCSLRWKDKADRKDLSEFWRIYDTIKASDFETNTDKRLENIEMKVNLIWDTLKAKEIKPTNSDKCCCD